MNQRPHAPTEGILTAEASAGLSSGLAGTSVSRRSFLIGAGAMVVLFSAKGQMGTAAAQEFEGGGGPGAPSPNQLDSWIAIGADGKVTAYTGKEEIGQGISTAQIQLVAEELCVPFSQVNLIYCDTDLTPDQGITSGSQSHPTNFNHRNLALAAATARETLVELASKRLGMPGDQLLAADGVISAKGDPSKKVSYGELIRGQRFEIQLDPNAKRKPASEWTVLGTEAQRPDLPALVTGKFEFVHNVRLPGMLHGRVVRPPVVGATVGSRRRKLGKGDAGRGEGGGEEKFRRGGCGETVAGNPGGEQVKSYLERRDGLAEPRRFLQLPEDGEADARHAAGEFQGC